MEAADDSTDEKSEMEEEGEGELCEMYDGSSQKTLEDMRKQELMASCSKILQIP